MRVEATKINVFFFKQNASNYFVGRVHQFRLNQPFQLLFMHQFDELVFLGCIMVL